jgi:hypothetical protein
MDVICGTLLLQHVYIPLVSTGSTFDRTCIQTSGKRNPTMLIDFTLTLRTFESDLSSFGSQPYLCHSYARCTCSIQLPPHRDAVSLEETPKKNHAFHGKSCDEPAKPAHSCTLPKALRRLSTLFHRPTGYSSQTPKSLHLTRRLVSACGPACATPSPPGSAATCS